MSVPSQKYVRNRLLAALPPEDYGALAQIAEPVALRRRDVLIEPDQPIAHVDFIETGLVSAVAVTSKGRRIEIGLVGSEGFVGTPILLDVDRTPQEAFVHGEGEALRIGSAPFRDLLERRPAIRPLLARYVHVLQLQTGQTALANGSSTLEQRLARWLLMCHDRIAGDEFPITHEFLSMTLGVRRPGVTTAIHVLEGSGMIKTRRSHIQILDRTKLKGAAGDGYGVPEREYQRLIPNGR